MPCPVCFTWNGMACARTVCDADTPNSEMSKWAIMHWVPYSPQNGRG